MALSEATSKPRVASAWTVVQVVGMLRSGTTVIGALLGDGRGAVAIGESNVIWRALRDDEVCSCGVSSSQCSLWARVRPRLLERLHDLGLTNFDAVNELSKRSVRIRTFLFMSAGGNRKFLDLYAAALYQLYDEVRSTSGAKIIVDTAKNPANVALASRAGVALYVLHLVRDPIAVAGSESMVYTYPNAIGPPVRGPAASAAFWSIYNITCILVRRKFPPGKTLRFEDAKQHPEQIIRLGMSLGVVYQDPLRRLGDVRYQHMLSGNPARMGLPRNHVSQKRIGKCSRIAVLALTPVRKLWRY